MESASKCCKIQYIEVLFFSMICFYLSEAELQVRCSKKKQQQQKKTLYSILTESISQQYELVTRRQMENWQCDVNVRPT